MPDDLSKVRLQFDVTRKFHGELLDAQSKTGATSLAEVFRKSSAIYAEIIKNEALGGKLILESADGKQERVKLI